MTLLASLHKCCYVGWVVEDFALVDLCAPQIFRGCVRCKSLLVYIALLAFFLQSPRACLAPNIVCFCVLVVWCIPTNYCRPDFADWTTRDRLLVLQLDASKQQQQRLEPLAV